MIGNPFSNLPPVVKNLLIINGLFFLAYITLSQLGILNLNDFLGLHYFGADDFKPVQYITYMFLHANIEHLFFNMFALFMFGKTLETVWGGKKFLIYYLITGIGAALIQTIVVHFEVTAILNEYQLTPLNPQYQDFLNAHLTVGASGAVFGILLAFGMLFPDVRLMLLIPPIPIKAKYFVIGYGVLELYLGMTDNGNVAHFAHLGGMLFGFILIKLWKNDKHDNNNLY